MINVIFVTPYKCLVLSMDKLWLPDEPWAEFSTLEVAACIILCTYSLV